MKVDCVFFENITKKWAYCSEEDEFNLKEDEEFCEKCRQYMRKIKGLNK